jgi:hypothetical protein
MVTLLVFADFPAVYLKEPATWKNELELWGSCWPPLAFISSFVDRPEAQFCRIIHRVSLSQSLQQFNLSRRKNHVTIVP